MTLRTAFDQSVYVKRSISETIDTLFLAFVLVVIVIFLFLRNMRATLVPTLAIPVSIVGAFGAMFILGYSVNTFTLLALILAIGLVVDDAIIVLENAYRHQEELGESPEVAAMHGTSEIGFAVIATTISLVAVFAPLAFLQGTTGRLFNEFGVALAGSVVISGFVALTLTPMLCAKILRVPKSHGRVFKALESGLDWMASHLRHHAGLGAAPPLDHPGRRGGLAGAWRSSPSRRSRASSSRRRTAASSWPPPRRRRAPRCSTPTPTRSRSRRSSAPPPRSIRTSASSASAAT